VAENTYLEIEVGMLIKKAADIRSSEITPRSLYLNRGNLWLGGDGWGGGHWRRVARVDFALDDRLAGNKLTASGRALQHHETITPFKDVSTYNNYYEFSTDKDGPAKLAGKFAAAWKVKMTVW